MASSSTTSKPWFRQRRRRPRHRQGRSSLFLPISSKLPRFVLILYFAKISLPPSLYHKQIINSFAAASQVQWTQNNNIAPEHRAAHNAPRSQKYWDEHGIERPDYAKTDAEIAAERGELSGMGAIILRGIGITLLLSLFFVSAIVWYGHVTGDWETINSSRVGVIVNKLLDVFVGLGGSGGHRLGSNAERKFSWLFGKKGDNKQGESEEEARRLRLARFDEAMKSE